MSEQGADYAGKEIAAGIKFFFICCGLAIFLGVLLWLSPDFLTLFFK